MACYQKSTTEFRVISYPHQLAPISISFVWPDWWRTYHKSLLTGWRWTAACDRTRVASHTHSGKSRHQCRTPGAPPVIARRLVIKHPLANAGTLGNGDLLLFVRLFVCRLWNLLSYSLRGSTWGRAGAFRIVSDTLVWRETPGFDYRSSSGSMVKLMESEAPDV